MVSRRVAAKMSYSRYLIFDIFGGILWVGAMILGGFSLGRSLPNIGSRIHYVIVVVAVLSILPAIIGIWRSRRGSPATAKPEVRRQPDSSAF